MNFEDLQKAWQAQPATTRVTINTDLLLKEVRRNQRHFATMIFWRDVREVVVIVPMAFYFIHRGWGHRWTDCLVGLACLEVAGYMIVDRWRQRRHRPAANDSLKGCVQSALHQVNHQIWLLKNVFWWYLLPIVATLAVSITVSSWHSRHGVVVAVTGFAFSMVFCGLVYWGVYWLNQYAVRKQLMPRREELENLLAGLE